MVRQDFLNSTKKHLYPITSFIPVTRGFFPSINTCWSSPRSCRWLPHVWLKTRRPTWFSVLDWIMINHENYPCNILVNRHNACWLDTGMFVDQPHCFWGGLFPILVLAFLLIDPFKMEQGPFPHDRILQLYQLISSYIHLKQWLIPIQNSDYMFFWKFGYPTKNENLINRNCPDWKLGVPHLKDTNHMDGTENWDIPENS